MPLFELINVAVSLTRPWEGRQLLGVVVRVEVCYDISLMPTSVATCIRASEISMLNSLSTCDVKQRYAPPPKHDAKGPSSSSPNARPKVV